MRPPSNHRVLLLLAVYVTAVGAQTPITDTNSAAAVALWRSDMTSAEATHGHIESWDLEQTTSMDNMFSYEYTFNADLNAWDVSSVTDTTETFHQAVSFNSELSGWDTSNLAYMSLMFYQASAFNRDLRAWDVASVVLMDNHWGGPFAGANVDDCNRAAIFASWTAQTSVAISALDDRRERAWRSPTNSATRGGARRRAPARTRARIRHFD